MFEVSKHHLGLRCKADGSTIYNIQNISTEVQSVAPLRVNMQANISCRRVKKKKNLRKHTEETNLRKNTKEPGPFFHTNRIQVKPRRVKKNKEKLFKVGRDTGRRREEEEKKSFK